MEPPLEGNKTGANPSQHFDDSTQYLQSGGQILDPQTKLDYDSDNPPGSQCANEYPHGGQYNQGEEGIYGPSPLPPESSWGNKDGLGTRLPPKRDRSPTSLDHFPNKRPRESDASAMMPAPPPPVPRGMDGERGAHDEHTDPYQNNTNNLGYRRPFPMPLLSQGGYGINPYDPSGRLNPPYGYEPRTFNPQGPHQEPRSRIDGSVQPPDPRNGRRAQTVAPGGHRDYEDSPYGIPLSFSNIDHSEMVLQSPIWISNSSGEQTRQREVASSQTTERSNQLPKDTTQQSPNNNNQASDISSQGPKSTAETPQSNAKASSKGNAVLAAQRKWKFDDGGVHGEGGSSSDEDMMLDPEVEGYNVHVGGFRRNKAVDPQAWLKPPSREYKPLDPTKLTHSNVLLDMAKRQRRRNKLLKRDLKGRWLKAQQNGDVKSMQKWERRAASANVPLNKVVPEYEDASSTPLPPQASKPLPLPSSAAQCEYDIRYPGHGAVVQYGSEHPPPAAQDATPWEESFRKSQENLHQTNVNATPYRADKVLPTASIPYHDRPNPAEMNHGYHHHPIRANIAEESLVGIDPVLKSKERMRRPPVWEDSPTPHSQARPEAAVSQRNPRDPPVVIDLCSSSPEPDDTPTFEPSKPMRERISPPSKKRATPKRRKFSSTTPRRSKKVLAKKQIDRERARQQQIDRERARQQRIADIIVAAELRGLRGDVDEELFGESILDSEDEEALAEAKRKEAQRKEEAKLMKESAEADARLAELKKQNEIAEAREKERLLKEREERNKKLKREQERKQQQAQERMLLEAKRKQAAERIEAQRAKDKADAEAREKAKEKNQTLEFDKLRLELLRKDIELKGLQAASLSGAKANRPNASKAPIPDPAEVEDSLFVPEASSSNEIDEAGAETGSKSFKRTSFRSMIARDREKLAIEKAAERAERAERALNTKKNAEATRVRPDAIGKSVESVKEKPKGPKRPNRSRPTTKNNAISHSEDTQNAPATESHSISGNHIEAESFQPKQNSSVPVRQNSVPIPVPLPPKTYSSEVRFITDVEQEENEKKRKIHEELAKRKRLAERRKKELPQIAAKQRSKILEEAKTLGITLTDQEIDHRVKCHMEKLEEAYQKKQERKALKAGIVFGSLSFDSYPAAQPQPEVTAQSGSLSQPQAESSETELPDNIAAAKRDRSSRYTPRTVQDLAAGLPQSDSESEEDPDDDDNYNNDKRLESFVAAAAKDGEKQTAGAGASNTNDRDTQNGDATNAEDHSQRATLQASEDPSSSKLANAKSQKPTQEEERKIKIYRSKTIEIKDGEELDESISPKILTDRDEANHMAKEILKGYREKAAGEEQSYSKSFKDGLFCGKVELDDQNSMTVEVIAEFSKPSNFGLDVATMNNRYGDKVWLIRRETKTTGKDEDGDTIITHVKEDAGDLVYTDRMYANHRAAEALITFIKPPEGVDIKFEEAWANEWIPQIRETANNAAGADQLFDLDVEASDFSDQAAWLEWDSARFWVEVRKTAGPRN